MGLEQGFMGPHDLKPILNIRGTWQNHSSPIPALLCVTFCTNLQNFKKSYKI